MHHIALVVDDDPHTLFFMEQILRPTGMLVEKAEDGIHAIQLLQAYTPSLLFLDLLLPRLSGLDVLGFMLETPRLNDTYVVVITAHNRSQFQPAALLDRTDLYLVKPIRPKEIRQLAQQVIASWAD